MKKRSIFLIVLITLMSATYMSSCNRVEKVETFEYDCPMKCEGAASHSPGDCPVCKMKLVKVERDNTEVGNDSVPTSKAN